MIKEKKEVTEFISRLLTTEEEEKKSSARNLEEQKTELVANSKVLDEKIANITQEISALKAKKKEKYSVNEKKLQAKRQEIEKFKPTIFVCGHSHICKVIYDEKYNMLYINPGAAGIVGFHKVRTIIRFELQLETIKNLEVIELKKRSDLPKSIQRTN